MKELTESALEHVLLAHPNAKIEQRGEDRVLLIPRYDIDSDRAWIEERKIVKDPDETKMGILPVFNVRTGEKFNPDGDPKTGAHGQLYRILGWSPPEKDKKD